MTSLAKPERAAVLCALLIMLLVSLAMGKVFEKFKQPRVVGEILGGVLLGPTFLGALWPEAFEFLFSHTDASASAIAFLTWLGLTFLMFQSGIETRDLVHKSLWRRVAWITAVGTAVPLLAGFGLGQWADFARFYGPKASPQTFGVFLGLMLAVTAIPVLSRILMDLGLLGTSFGRTILGVALVEDLVLWAGLAVLLNLGHDSGQSSGHAIASVAITLAFFAVCYLWGHKAAWLIARAPVLRSASEETIVFVVLLSTMLAGYLVGVRMIFGAFLAGRIVARAFPDRHWTGSGLSVLVIIFFASVGVRVDLTHGFDALGLLALTALALVVKTVATWLGSALAGIPARPGFHLSVVLNARGALGIVLATIGLEAELINATAFSTLIMLALLTSMLAGTWLQWVNWRCPEQLELDGPSVARRLEPGAESLGMVRGAGLVETGLPGREG